MTENKPNTSSIFHTDFLPFAIRWGRGLSLFGIVLAFGPCLGLAVMGIFPSVSGVMAGIAAQLPAVVAAYFYEQSPTLPYWVLQALIWAFFREM